MPVTPEHLTSVRQAIGRSIQFSDLVRTDWSRQTDAVRLMFSVASLFAELGERVIFTDGHISDVLKREAVSDPAGVKQFFNRRCHDMGFTSRRVLIYDTLGTRLIEGKGSGRHKLHFHAVLERPLGWNDEKVKQSLTKIFGRAQPMGRRQLHISHPQDDKHYSHGGVRFDGVLGKVAYAISHAGTTYASLDLNDGKRSRSAPRFRSSCNKNAKGLARGIPSNFNADIVLCDSETKRGGKRAFEAWVKEEKLKATSSKPLEPEGTAQGITRAVA